MDKTYPIAHRLPESSCTSQRTPHNDQKGAVFTHRTARGVEGARKVPKRPEKGDRDQNGGWTGQGCPKCPETGLTDPERVEVARKGLEMTRASAQLMRERPEWQQGCGAVGTSCHVAPASLENRFDRIREWSGGLQYHSRAHKYPLHCDPLAVLEGLSRHPTYP